MIFLVINIIQDFMKITNREFYKSIKQIAIYVAIQNTISSSLMLVDVIMLGSLGGSVINGPGLAGQFFYVFSLGIFGFANGGQIYLSQFFGDKNMDNYHKTIGVIFTAGFVLSTLFFIASFFFSEEILSLYSSDASVIISGGRYLKIISVNAPLILITSVLAAASRSVGDAKLPMIVSTLSLFLNTFLNYGLIYGNLGFPEYGYIGAAYATVISCLVGALINVFVIVRRKDVVYARLKEYLNFNFQFFKKISISSSPVMMNELLWALGFSLYSMAYSTYNTSAYTSYIVYMVINNIMYSAAIGLAIADSVVLGNILGSGDIEKAKAYEKKFTVFQMQISVVCAVLLVIAANYIPDLFNFSVGIRAESIKLLYVGAVFMPIKFYTMLHIVGTMRAGGDLRASVLIDILTMYLIGVPMGFIALHYFDYPLWLAQVMISMEEVVKAILCFYRIRSGKWARNLTTQKEFLD